MFISAFVFQGNETFVGDKSKNINISKVDSTVRIICMYLFCCDGIALGEGTTGALQPALRQRIFPKL